MKTIIAGVVAGLFLIAAAAPADARGHGGGGRGGGGHSSGGHSSGGHAVRGGHGGGHFQGHHFRGHGFRSSVFVGGVWAGPYWGPYWDPYWYPGYYPPAYYSSYPYYSYDPAPVAAAPQSYIEQSTPSYWYYCEAVKTYYPYVRECPGGWLTVLPQAAPESQR